MTSLYDKFTVCSRDEVYHRAHAKRADVIEACFSCGVDYKTVIYYFGSVSSHLCPFPWPLAGFRKCSWLLRKLELCDGWPYFNHHPSSIDAKVPNYLCGRWLFTFLTPLDLKYRVFTENVFFYLSQTIVFFFTPSCESCLIHRPKKWL